jgi:hypothetical protein
MPWFGRVPIGSWLIGIAMVVILGEIASPFVMSYFGYGVPFRGPGLPMERSDAFTIIGAFFCSWCIGWAVSKLVDRWSVMKGRRPPVWIGYIAAIAFTAATHRLFYLVPLKPFYAQFVTLSCATMVMFMVLNAFRADGDRSADEDTRDSR